jgi:hypothetical protein
MTKQVPTPCATFFVSTGRCGTQWLADKLSAHYSDLAVVRHEPFQEDYQPRRYFAAYHRGEDIPLSATLDAHLRAIETTLQRCQYIETGWPAYGVLPSLLRRFEGRARVVHLYRHPFATAASLATHQVYDRGDWSEAVSITPSEDGVVQSELRGARWEAMPEYEKCLFWWTELNHFAFTVHRDFPTVPWCSIGFEEMFDGDGRGALSRLLKFLSLPVRESFINSRAERTDTQRFKASWTLDTIDLAMYPMAAKVMDRLGYEDDPLLIQQLRRRYSRAPLRRWAGRTWRALRSLAGAVEHVGSK